MKKFMRLICAVLLCIVASFGFIACNLVELDTAYALNQEIIEVKALGKTKVFTRGDLITAYERYGYKNYQNGGSLEDAIKKTKEDMIQRYLLIEYIASNEITLTNYNGVDYTSEIRYRALNSMQERLDAIEEEVRKDFDKTIDIVTPEEVKSLRDKKKVYEPTVKLDEETGNLVRVEAEKEEVHKNVPDTFEEYNKEFQSIDKQINGEVWSRYIKELQAEAENEGRSTDRDKVLEYKQKELEEFYRENVLLELYQEKVLAEAPINTDAVVDYYKDKFKAAYSLYDQNISKYHSTISSSTSDLVYYHPTNNNDGYMLVQHILINFGADNTTKIDELKEKVKSDSSYDVDGDGNPFNDEPYLKEYNRIINNVDVTYEKDGVKETKRLPEVLAYIKSYVAGGATPLEKLQKFDELMYVYNDDKGNMNNDFYYYVYKTDDDAEDYNPDETTNEPNNFNEYFADASREFLVSENGYSIGDIYSGGNNNGLVVASYQNSETSKKEYSAHIIIYGGDAENIVTYSNLDNLTWQDLCARYTSPLQEKTIFQFIYDKINNDSNIYSEKAESIINTIQDKNNSEYQVIDNEYKYKDMWK